MSEKITVEAHVNAPIEKVWDDYTNPDAITVWNSPSAEWHTTAATNEVKVGGRFSSRMEAKDGSEGFDFSGVYTDVAVHERLAYTMDDGRKAEVTFTPEDDGVNVIV